MQNKYNLIYIVAYALGISACSEEASVEPAEEMVEVMEPPNPAVLKKIDKAAAMMAMEQGPLVYDRAYFLEDAIQLDDGKERIDNGLMEILADHENLPEGLNITWTPHGADIAASGELGYTWGRWSNFAPGDDGEVIETFGKYLTIWKKQEDGSWKIAVDIWNRESAN